MFHADVVLFGSRYHRSEGITSLHPRGTVHVNFDFSGAILLEEQNSNALHQSAEA
jgi:hypothetical protein